MTIQNDTIVHAIIDVCYCQPPREWSTMGVHQHMSSHMQPVNYCYILEILSHILGVLARPRLHSRFSASRSGGFLDIPSKKGATAALRARTATVTVRLSAAEPFALATSLRLFSPVRYSMWSELSTLRRGGTHQQDIIPPCPAGCLAAGVLVKVRCWCSGTLQIVEKRQFLSGGYADRGIRALLPGL